MRKSVRCVSGSHRAEMTEEKRNKTAQFLGFQEATEIDRPRVESH
jgi:hypothetical protein